MKMANNWVNLTAGSSVALIAVKFSDGGRLPLALAYYCKNMKNIPSDFQLLAEIYCRYQDQFKNFSEKSPGRATKTYVPIDIEAIAKHFGTDPEIIFGRLRYHLDQKYGYEKNGKEVPFFLKEVNQDKNAVNFPMLASVIAGLREERNRQNTVLKISIAAIIISLVSLGVSSFKVWHEIKHEDAQHSQDPPKQIPPKIQETIKK